MLGLTFKRDTDDERDSLSHKLIRLLERELADVAVCDPHVPDADRRRSRRRQGRRRRDRRDQPLRVRAARALRTILELPPTDCCSWIRGTPLGTGQVFVYAAEARLLDEPARAREARGPMAACW